MKLPAKIGLPGLALVLLAGLAVAGGGGRRFGGGRFGGDQEGPFVRTEDRNAIVNEDTVRTARETITHSTEAPNWTNKPGFDKDVFTFARIIYKYKPGWRSSHFGWVNDYPDSDLNLSYRLQQMTSLKVDPDGRVLKLTNPDLPNYPFIYAVKAGRLELRDEEVPILRKYLLNGGVFMADDFWGDADWDSFEEEMKRVFPERTWQELDLSHPIFHCVFDLKVKDKNLLQVPWIGQGVRSADPNSPSYGVTWRGGEDTKEMHVRAWLDEKGRIMIIALHNSNTGDGWEREGQDFGYFQTYSEQRAFPIAINIIFYTMTH